MKIGLDSESCHLLFHNGIIDIFGFIRKVAELGLDGVMINIIGGMAGDNEKYIHPEWGCLGGAEPEHLEKVRKELQKYNMYAEVAMRGIDPLKLSRAVEVCHQIGADLLRTYCCFGKYDPETLAKAPDNFKKIIPHLKKYRMKFAIENHEEETSDEIIDILNKVNSPWVGSHCDIGNSMMAWEDPLIAVEKLSPYAFTSHFKDHIVVKVEDEYMVCGVPLGKGNIDIDECFRLLFEKSTLTRINIEQTYPFLSVFKRERGTGGVFDIGEGAFKLENTVFNFKEHTADSYYYPADEYLKETIAAQESGLKESIRYIKKIRDKYCC
ncbi:MAG: sugar phosphate isomerase/epimerase family protein [Spirochaetia bacterium]|jgi:sugar phosphate isomerase/epimerase|nr:sugar phosphate isomerase/epimerase family protein [Spirochaetia bacterium]